MAAPHLRLFDAGSFAFIISNIVLQHVQPSLATEYLREFLRILAPGGVLIFQLPSHQRIGSDAPPPPSMTAVPDEAYAASVQVLNIPIPTLAPASAITLDVEVTNRSGFEWTRQTFGVIRTGNHWLDASGQVLVRDDGRADLPDSVPSGETCRVPLAVVAPAHAGDYVCEIDLAHEGVTWFGDRGSTTLRLAMRVRSPLGRCWS